MTLNEKTIDDYLSSIYYDAKNPSSFGSIKSLHDSSKIKFPGIPKERISEWLSKQYTYTLHRNARRNFIRNKIYVSHIDEQWEADLVDMQEYSKQNNGYKYILTVIDVLSKFLWAIPLKSKTSGSIVSAFKLIINDRKPLKLKTDQGLEFNNLQFKNLCLENNIRYFTSRDKKIKCSIVERVNRTLKEKMFRYFTAKGTRKYIDVLQNLVYAYNNRWHRSIKLKPSEVTEDNEKFAYQNLYGPKTLKNIFMHQNSGKQLQIPIGSTVRRTYELTPFDKAYYPNWTDKTYEITKIIKKPQKSQYILKDYKNNSLKRRFYPEEIQRISPNTEYRVEKVLRKRKINGKLEFLVKWMGYPSSDNSWISGKDLISLKKNK
jgi:hypothetical protein